VKCKKPGCKANALKDDDFCFFHSQKPNIIAKRVLAQSRGGRKTQIHRDPVSIESLDDIQVTLLETLNEIRCSSTENTVSRARAIAYICLSLANIQDRVDLEKRVEAMENSFLMTT
jgi:hypothetical protein